MSHFAEIDSNNIVIRVLVGDNNSTDEGESFFKSLGGTWIKTSYNGNIRKRFAAIGYSYLPELDAFLMPKCHEEAIFNATEIEWKCSNVGHIEKLS
jgi:hypothetical protein